MSSKVKMALYVVGGIFLVLVIDKKTGLFTNVFSKVPGLNTLLA